MEIPLPPSQQKSSSLILAQLANARAVKHEETPVRKLDLNMDEKQLRRTISNRLSAQRARKKRSQHMSDMEKMVKDLQDKISVLTQQVEIYKENRKELLLEYDSLQQLVETRAIESKISEIEIEQKRLEICRLKELAKISKNNSNELVQKRRKISSRDSIN